MSLSRRGFFGALAGAAAALVVPRKKTFFFGMGLPAFELFDVDRALATIFIDGRRWAKCEDRDEWIEVWTGRRVSGHQLFMNGGMKPTDENLDLLADANVDFAKVVDAEIRGATDDAYANLMRAVNMDGKSVWDIYGRS